MSRLTFLPLNLLFIVFAGCAVADVEPKAPAPEITSVLIDKPTQALPTLLPAENPTNTPVPTTTAAPVPTRTIVPLPMIGPLSFSMAEGGGGASKFFAAEEIYVEFEFANVSDGALLRLDWYAGDELFASVEESWDAVAFSENGKRQDFSISNFDDGLPSDRYQLKIYLEDALLSEGEFRVVNVPQKTAPVLLPDPDDSEILNFRVRGIGLYSAEEDGQAEQPKEIVTQWFSHSLEEGDVIRHDWYFNDQFFASQEEVWSSEAKDEGRFSSEGSISNEGDDLPLGQYRVELFLNDEKQVSQSIDVVEFYTLPPLVEPISGKRLTTTSNNTVVVTNPDKSVKQRSVEGRVNHFDWFPSGNKVVFASKILTGPRAYDVTFAHKHELWLWDLTTDELQKIGSAEDNFSLPRVSPDGTKIAVVAGNGYGSGCESGYRLSVLEVEGLTITQRMTPHDFNIADATAVVSTSGRFPDEAYTKNQIRPKWSLSSGVWLDSDRFKTKLEFSDCENHGTYELDFSTLRASKID